MARPVPLTPVYGLEDSCDDVDNAGSRIVQQDHIVANQNAPISIGQFGQDHFEHTWQRLQLAFKPRRKLPILRELLLQTGWQAFTPGKRRGQTLQIV